jgi:hypothetical protein
MPRSIRLLLATLVLMGALPAGASAQIYVERDANGSIVFSDRRLGPNAVTYSVPGTSGVRTTRALTTPASRDIDELIDHHAARQHVRPELVRAVIAVESGFNPRARSHKGAMGLMQLMPATAAQFGVERPYDPAQNIAACVAYLRELLDRYANDETLALAAYNAGPAAVERYGHRIPPYRETRDYVARIRGKTNGLEARAQRIRPVIYRTVDVVDGREVPRYTNVRPAPDTAYEVIGRQQ